MIVFDPKARIIWQPNLKVQISENASGHLWLVDWQGERFNGMSTQGRAEAERQLLYQLESMRMNPEALGEIRKVLRTHGEWMSAIRKLVSTTLSLYVV